MIIHSDGKKAPSRFLTKWYQLKTKLKKSMQDEIVLNDGKFDYHYLSNGLFELYRPMTLLIKEEGTFRWIDRETKAGDVVYDIGANIGIYTLSFGKRVGANGQVYAFEPHVATFSSLIRNVEMNQLEKTVSPLCVALNFEEGLFDFNYFDWELGSTASQLGHNKREDGQSFRPVGKELKLALTIDGLIAKNYIRPADLIKLDVDGNELKILQGMTKLLNGTKPPRAIQVEMNINVKDQVETFMREQGYSEKEKHYTHSGKLQLAKGADAKFIPYNSIFVK